MAANCRRRWTVGPMACACALILVLLMSPAVFAQTAGTASIQGLVTDVSLAGIPAAPVTVKNIDTGVVTEIRTNDSGFFRAAGLVPGRYEVSSQTAGLSEAKTTLRLEVSQTARVNLVLKLGDIVEEVTVQAPVAALNTETTEVGQVIDGKRIAEMPLLNRNYLELSKLAAGVAPGVTTRSAPEGGFAAFGARTYQNSIYLDGVDNSSRASGGRLGFEAQAVQPSVDAVAEFKVITNNVSAEYGYRLGGKVIVSTKAGTNRFHGSLYEFHRSGKYDANDWEANKAGKPKPKYERNQFGASLGGPIVKDKTHFFASYEGTRYDFGATGFANVPSLEQRNGDFSKELRRQTPTGQLAGRVIYDPATQRQVSPCPLTPTSPTSTCWVRDPFPGNVVPKERWDPLVAKILALYPAPNSGNPNQVQNYFYDFERTDRRDQFDVRIDHALSSSHKAFARYSYRDQYVVLPGTLPLPADGSLWETNDIKAHNGALNLTSFWGGKLNELRVGFTHYPTVIGLPYTENLNAEYGIKGAPGDLLDDGRTAGWTRLLPSGYDTLGARDFWPNYNTFDHFMIADAFTWIKGRHALKFGGEYRLSYIDRNAQRWRRGTASFTGVYTAQYPDDAGSRSVTGDGLADFLLGYGSTYTMGTPQGEKTRTPYYGLFLQDDWKIHRRLTLNIGLRWEYFGAVTFPDPETQTVAQIRIPEYYKDLAAGSAPVVVRPKDGSDAGYSPSATDFGPRLGAAWQLNDKTVIRAGVGMYFGEADQLQDAAYFVSGPPLSYEVSPVANRINPVFFLQQGYPALPTGTLPANANIRVYPGSPKTQYTAQYYLEVQRALPWEMVVAVGYAGASSRHLINIANINLPLTPHPTTPVSQRRRLRSDLNQINEVRTDTNAAYDSVFVKWEKKFTRGFSFLHSLTWSHARDAGVEILSGAGGGGPNNPYDWKNGWGNSSQDRRWVYAGSVVWELPFGQDRRWLKSGPASWLLGDWQMAVLYRAMTGPYASNTAPDTQNNGGAARGTWVRSPNLPRAERTENQWFDTGFAVQSEPGVVSNVGRNIIELPGYQTMDASLVRTIRAPWGTRLQLRFETFNTLNIANWGNPGLALGGANYGRITGRAGEQRRLQFAVKYIF